MEELMEFALKKSDEAEIFCENEKTDSIIFEDMKLKDIESKHQSGVSIRLIKDKKLGFAYTKNLLNREELLQNALDSLKGGINVNFEFPFSSGVKEINTYDSKISSLTNEKIVNECIRINDYLSSRTKGQINISADKDIRDIRILNSKNTDLKTEISRYSLSIEILFPGSYSSINRIIQDKGFICASDEYLNYLINMYNKSLNIVKPDSGKMKVLFMPEVMYVLMWRLLSATSGKSIYKKESPLSGKIGEKIFNESITVYDNPLDDNFAGARSFDDEGVQKRKLSIIENGIIKNYYYDLLYGSKMGGVSTGHGFRTGRWGGESISIEPNPALLHLTIKPGNKTFNEMISLIDRGIIVVGALGAHSGNIPNGDFSIGLAPGLWVEGGEIAGRVTDTMIADNIYNMMKNVIAVENKTYTAYTGNYPSILFDDVSVAI